VFCKINYTLFTPNPGEPENPRPDGVKKLKGLVNTYRIRVGDYRVIYRINDQELMIVLLNSNHRKDVYR
jgi:mRNA interferase RelE/StbE